MTDQDETDSKRAMEYGMEKKEDWWGVFVSLWDVVENGHIVGDVGLTTRNEQNKEITLYTVYDAMRLRLVCASDASYRHQMVMLSSEEYEDSAFLSPDDEVIEGFDGAAQEFSREYKHLFGEERFQRYEELFWEEIFPGLDSAFVSGVQDVAYRGYATRHIPDEYREEFYETLEKRL